VEGNESYCFQELSIEEKKIPLLLLQMAEEIFVEVYEIGLKLCYLHLLIIIFPCGFRDFYGTYQLKKEGVTCF
jgi:hypothetical protein